MLNFIREETNKTFTENGGNAYHSTFNYNLDLFARAGALRVNGEMYTSMLERLMSVAFLEDRDLFIKNIFYLRDVRHGNKERTLGREGLVFYADRAPEDFIKIMKWIPEIGRWDDLVYVMTHTENEEVARKVATCLKLALDVDFCKVLKGDIKDLTLVAKWLPSGNAGKRDGRDLKKYLALTGDNRIRYQRKLKRVRKELNLVETKITEEDFDSIDYATIPGQALVYYKDLFLRKGGGGYYDYLEALDNGEIKGKTDTMTPVDIVGKIMSRGMYNLSILPETDKKFYNSLWRDLSRVENDTNMIVVRDGSGSMIGTPLDAATALAIYTSELLTGEFKDKFITFSSEPRLVELPSNASIVDKVDYLLYYDDMTNTDIEKVYDLIYRAQLLADPADYLDTILIISDMQFDPLNGRDTTFDYYRKLFTDAGMPMPHVVFWNVDGTHDNLPVTMGDNVTLASGYSTEILGELMRNKIKTPVERMIDVLSRYDYMFE